MAAIMQEIGKRKRQATGIFIPHPQISPTDSSIDPRKPVQAQRKFAQGSSNLMGLIVPTNDQLLLNGSISESEEEDDECSSFPTDNVKNETEEFISFLSFRGTDVLPDHLKHFNRPYGIKIPLVAKLSPTCNESKSVLQQKKDDIAKWQTNGRVKTRQSIKGDVSPTKKLITTPIMKIKSRLHSSFSSTNSRKITNSHINITSAPKTRKLSGAKDSCLNVNLYPIDSTQFSIPKPPASLRNKLSKSTVNCSDKSPQRTTAKLSPYKRVTRSFAFTEQKVSTDQPDLSITLRKLSTDESKSATVERKTTADQLTKVMGKKAPIDRSKATIAERKTSANQFDSARESKFSEKKAARHRSYSTDVEKKALVVEIHPSIKRKASTDKSTLPTTEKSLIRDKMKEPDKVVSEHPPRLARKTKEMATVFMSVINSGLPFQKCDSYSASSSGGVTPVSLPARCANKRPSLPDNTPISPKAKKKRSLSDIQDHIQVKSLANSVYEPRPTRRTKEAATIFMSELTRRLLHGDRESDDDNSSIESYPELPRQRDCNSNMKTELPQLITKRRSTIIARFSENNDNIPNLPKVISENKKQRKERLPKTEDHSETKPAVPVSDARTTKVQKCVVSERIRKSSCDSYETQDRISQCVSKTEEVINTREIKSDSSDNPENLLENKRATPSSKKVISEWSPSLQNNATPSKSEIEMREKIAIAFEKKISSKNRPKNIDKSKVIEDDRSNTNNTKNVSLRKCNAIFNKNKLRNSNNCKNDASSNERKLKTNKSRFILKKSSILLDENVKITPNPATPAELQQALPTLTDEFKICSLNVSESDSISVDRNSKEPREVNEIKTNEVSDYNVECDITFTPSCKPGTVDEISKEAARGTEIKMNDLGDKEFISNIEIDIPAGLCQKLNLDGNEFAGKRNENEITTKKSSDVASKNKDNRDISLVPRIILNSIDKELADKAKATDVACVQLSHIPLNSISTSNVLDINSSDVTEEKKTDTVDIVDVNSDDNSVCDIPSTSCARSNDMDQNLSAGVKSIVYSTSSSKSNAIEEKSVEIEELKIETNELSADVLGENVKLDVSSTTCSKENIEEIKPETRYDSSFSLQNEVTSSQKLNVCAVDSSLAHSSTVEMKLIEPTSGSSGLMESSAKVSSTPCNKTLRFDYLDMKKELISKAKGEKKDRNVSANSKERPTNRVNETNAFNVVKKLLQRQSTGDVLSKPATATNISIAGPAESNTSSCDLDDSCVGNDTDANALYDRDFADVEKISIDLTSVDASKKDTLLEVDASIVVDESARECNSNKKATPEVTNDDKTLILPAFPDINISEIKSDYSQTLINNRIEENDDVLKTHYTRVFGSNNVVRTSKFSSKNSDRTENSISETSTKTINFFSTPDILESELDFRIRDYNEETDDLSKIDYSLASSSNNLSRATSEISSKMDGDFIQNSNSEILPEMDDLPKCGESERMLYEEKCAKYLEENIKIRRSFDDCSLTDEKFCKPLLARNFDDKNEENYLEVESLPSTDSDVFSGYKTPTKSVASPASSTKSSNFSFKYDSGILSPSSSCLRDNGSGTESRDDLSSNDEASSPSTRKRVIFQQRRPLASRLQEIKENVRLKTLAFSPHNEKSVYAFEPELPGDSPVLGRKASTSEAKKCSSKTSKHSVKVKSSAKKILKCASPIDDSCESADSVGNESQLFYIPLEASTGVGKSQTLIQGVALKLGTKGPDQKLVMSATIVTKSPDTFTTGTAATTISPSMLGGDQLRDVIRCSTMHPLERKKYKAPPPVAIVQPTTRVKDDAKAPINNVTRSLEDAHSFTSDIRTSPPTTKRTARKNKPTTPAKRDKNINSPPSSVRNNWSSTKKHSQTCDSSASSSTEKNNKSKLNGECEMLSAEQNPVENVSSVRESDSLSGVKTLISSSEENSAIRSAVTRVRKQLLHSLQEDSLQANIREKRKRPKKDLIADKKSNDKKGKKMKCEKRKDSSVSESEGQLTEAPVFYPNAEEFQNPMDYIESITEKAKQFGICKICPPASFKPECRVVDEMRFMAYNQYVHKMLKRWGPNVKELMVIKKYLETQNISLNEYPLVGGMEIDLPRLYHTVKELGGLKEVIEERKWQEVAEKLKISKLAHDRLAKLDDIYCKYLLPYSTLSKEERNKLFLQVEKEWKTYSKEDVKNEFFEEVDECILKGKTIPLSTFYRIARNTLFMWGSKVGEEAQTDEQIEESFWDLVSKRKAHVCVHSGSIDCGTFGYGFPVGKNSSLAKHPWNLKVFTNNEASILRYLSPIIGVTVPTLHVGMLYSAGCWFRDPHGLPWVEYLHTGGSKIWYGISDSSNEQFRKVMECMVPQYCRPGKVWLPSDTVMVPPECLTSRGLNLSRVVQHPGEFILVFPKAFTSTVSTGYIVSESVYFAQASWLDFAEQIFQDMRDSSEPSIFSLEQLLINIANDSRSQVQLLRKILPLLNDMRDSELALRSQLKEFDLNKIETIDRSKKRKTNKIKSDDDGDFECDKCRRSLFVSMVKNSNTGTDYCLLHAVKYLYKRRSQAKNCIMIYFYTKEELENIITSVTRRVEGAQQREVETVANTMDK